ncbi:peptidase M23-like protein [Azomonas agilis]|uniref:Peptidase M23-like protein n=1 Tax=Azomonas agilis TaxID=116849 RepID=A0A562IZ18_9GAMM|nr:peptidase M23-like protein [Azomonas agilis]
MSQQQEQLSARQERLKQQQSELVQLRETRRATLATLNREYKTQTQKIQARRKEHQQLEQNLKRVEEVLAQQARIAEEARRKAQEQARAQQQAAAAAKAQQRQAASETEPAEPRPTTAVASASTSSSFAAQRGRLPWPINGALLARYGEQRGGDARMTWDGVLIQASVGTPVKAIHAGRVVFADWLRGAGLLVIVDHGNGYLSLYGHNQTLLRTAGDVVRVGDPIATVGNSGGQEQAALYFAIRHQGRPSDPAQWCHAQG